MPLHKCGPTTQFILCKLPPERGRLQSRRRQYGVENHGFNINLFQTPEAARHAKTPVKFLRYVSAMKYKN